MKIEQLKRLIEIHADGSQARFALKLGKSPSQVNQWLTGRRPIGAKIENDIMAKFGPIERETSNVSNAPISFVPLLSWVRAGDFCEASGALSKDDAQEWLPAPLQSMGKNVFALEVRGDSMDATSGYREGEFVYIDPDMAASHGKDVLARIENGLTLKRYKVDEEGAYLLQLNGNKIIRPSTEWNVCGVVVFSGQRR